MLLSFQLSSVKVADDGVNLSMRKSVERDKLTPQLNWTDGNLDLGKHRETTNLISTALTIRVMQIINKNCFCFFPN